jgi:hypothetical protein
MITTSPIGYVRRSGKPFPLSVLKCGETFNNYNGDTQRLHARGSEAGRFLAEITHLSGLDRGKRWYCYVAENPICHAESATIARRWEARLKARAKRPNPCATCDCEGECQAR